MNELQYPFDVNHLIKYKKKIKNELLLKRDLNEKKIAILGGSTTSEIKNMLEIFLLNNGIKPIFYESEYNKYYEDSVFGNKILDAFNPDVIFIHTTNRNIVQYPKIQDDLETINEIFNNEYQKFEKIWTSLFNKFNAVIIQNNFEYPFYRLMGNKDASDIHGRLNFITKLNQKFYDYANNRSNFFINDINYVSSCYGLDKWANQFYWHMYKYAMDLHAIPYLAFNLANIIKSIYGKNKKAFVLDLDNTLWGGVVGDDGVENLTIGSELPMGEVFSEFQKYLQECKNLGVLLNINSKNDYDVAISGLNHPSCILKLDDFIVVKTNWKTKDSNIKEIAEELNIALNSLVFIDDNPAERKIVNDYLSEVAVPEMLEPENYIRVIDHNGYFEMTNFTLEDMNKSNMYKENAKRVEMMSNFENYDDYLVSLKMKAEIQDFKVMYLERISQLTNKTNQFNLTNKRYSLADIESIKNDDNYIKIYGKLEDIFGDNGLVTVIIGNIKNNTELHIDLWIMSCRVLKRNMEFAMMDILVKKAKEKNIKTIYGYYNESKKNQMVSDFYIQQGFDEISCDDNGNKIYKLDVADYFDKNNIIEVNIDE